MATASSYRSSTRSGLRVQHLERCGRNFYLGVSSSDSEVFRSAVAVIRALPTSDREYLPDDRLWWISESGMRQLARELREVGEALMRHESVGEERENDPWIRRMAEEAMRQQNAQRREVVVPPDIAEGFKQLHLQPSAPEELIKAAYRVLSKRVHPDVAGGDHLSMVRLGKAHEKALTWSRKQHERGEFDPPPSAA
jgi:hypothetical protein